MKTLAGQKVSEQRIAEKIGEHPVGEWMTVDQKTSERQCRHSRPGFSDAAKPDIATKLYDEFNEKLRKQNVHVETGIFGAMMEVELVNDGPVTIIIDSKQK